MVKCNEIISKMMLYDNDDEHKGSNVDSEENLHCKHPVFYYIILTICNVNVIIDTIIIRRIIKE